MRTDLVRLLLVGSPVFLACSTRHARAIEGRIADADSSDAGDVATSAGATTFGAPHADSLPAPEHSGPVRWVPIERPGFFGPFYRWVGPCADVKVKHVQASAPIRVDKALGGIIPGATKCYMFVLQRGFEGEGLLSLDLRLLPDGGVDMAKMNEGLWPALDGCIRSVASRSHFQPLGDGGATVTVLLDLSLRDAGAQPCNPL